MTLSDWILINGIWLGFKTAASSRSSPGRGLLAALAGLGFVGFLVRITVAAQTVSLWWVGCGVILEISAWRALRGSRRMVWSDWIETVGAALCLGFGTGLWEPLAFGVAAGGLISVSVGQQGRLGVERLSSITLGAVGLNDFWAGIHGNLPAHHLSWLWAVPWLIAGECFVIFSAESRGWQPRPKRLAPRWPRPRDFAR